MKHQMCIVESLQYITVARLFSIEEVGNALDILLLTACLVINNTGYAFFTIDTVNSSAKQYGQVSSMAGNSTYDGDPLLTLYIGERCACCINTEQLVQVTTYGVTNNQLCVSISVNKYLIVFCPIINEEI